MGDPSGRWLFVAHGALGLAILGVLALKLQRVTPVVLSSHGRKVSATIGILTALATVATVGIGVWWVVVQTPTRYPNGMILHTTFGFVLLGFALWHCWCAFARCVGAMCGIAARCCDSSVCWQAAVRCGQPLKARNR
jgi:hypothetical protein